MTGSVNINIKSSGAILINYVVLFEQISDSTIEYRLQDENLVIFNQGAYISNTDIVSVTITDREEPLKSFEVSLGKSFGKLFKEEFFIVFETNTGIRKLYPSQIISEIEYEVTIDPEE